jgi:hypothetical protein
MKCLCFLFLFSLAFSVKGQINSVYSEKDTLKYGYRSSGSIDSMDIKVSGILTNIPGGSFGNQSYLTNDFLMNHAQFQLLQGNTLNQSFKFSALPHIGFNYSFGSKGTQLLNVDYEQAFKKNVLLNVFINQNSSQGVLKNSDFTSRSFQINLRRNGKFFSFKLEGNYSYKKTKLNGGVYNDSTILSNGLEYVNVLSSTANKTYSEHKNVNLLIDNHFNVLKDSLRFLGLITRHHLKIDNRVYNEQMTSLSNYNHYYIDSFITRDQFQLASLKNGAGIFTKLRNVYFDALLNYRYWNTQNITIHHDTSEVDLSSSLKVLNKKYSFVNSFNFNLIGAKNEWSNETSISTKISKLHASIYGKVEQKLPIPFQRYYYSNNYTTTLSNYQLQSRILLNGSLKYVFDSLKQVGVEATSLTMNNNYFFIDSVWRNDILKSFSNTSLTVFGSYTFRKITIQPRCVFSFPTSNFQYVPKYNLNARIFRKGRAFKSKKLEYIYGADISWISDYKLMNYSRVLDVMTLNQSKSSVESMVNVGAFFGITINEFRMYARMSNIGYFWNNRLNQQLVGYPIQKNLIQLGITWDFFN